MVDHTQTRVEIKLTKEWETKVKTCKIFSSPCNIFADDKLPKKRNLSSQITNTHSELYLQRSFVDWACVMCDVWCIPGLSFNNAFVCLSLIWPVPAPGPLCDSDQPPQWPVVTMGRARCDVSNRRGEAASGERGQQRTEDTPRQCRAGQLVRRRGDLCNGG